MSSVNCEEPKVVGLLGRFLSTLESKEPPLRIFFGTTSSVL
ncbi:MAG TPA: hypothetical protein VKA95_01535 [Nitrososphaeraceae archaeon]|nr:hypothetical protein [Nitrososphaeraceae archaeon]